MAASRTYIRQPLSTARAAACFSLMLASMQDAAASSDKTLQEVKKLQDKVKRLQTQKVNDVKDVILGLSADTDNLLVSAIERLGVQLVDLSNADQIPDTGPVHTLRQDVYGLRQDVYGLADTIQDKKLSVLKTQVDMLASRLEVHVQAWDTLANLKKTDNQQWFKGVKCKAGSTGGTLLIADVQLSLCWQAVIKMITDKIATVDATAGAGTGTAKKDATDVTTAQNIQAWLLRDFGKHVDAVSRHIETLEKDYYKGAVSEPARQEVKKAVSNCNNLDSIHELVPVCQQFDFKRDLSTSLERFVISCASGSLINVASEKEEKEANTEKVPDWASLRAKIAKIGDTAPFAALLRISTLAQAFRPWKSGENAKMISDQMGAKLIAQLDTAIDDVDFAAGAVAVDVDRLQAALKNLTFEDETMVFQLLYKLHLDRGTRGPAMYDRQIDRLVSARRVASRVQKFENLGSAVLPWQLFCGLLLIIVLILSFLLFKAKRVSQTALHTVGDLELADGRCVMGGFDDV